MQCLELELNPMREWRKVRVNSVRSSADIITLLKDYGYLVEIRGKLELIKKLQMIGSDSSNN